MHRAEEGGAGKTCNNINFKKRDTCYVCGALRADLRVVQLEERNKELEAVLNAKPEPTERLPPLVGSSGLAPWASTQASKEVLMEQGVQTVELSKMSSTSPSLKADLISVMVQLAAILGSLKD